MKEGYKYIILMFFLFSFVLMYGQENRRTIVIDNVQQGNNDYEYVARDSVKIRPGFSSRPGSGKKLKAFTHV